MLYVRDHFALDVWRFRQQVVHRLACGDVRSNFLAIRSWRKSREVSSPPFTLCGDKIASD